MRVTIEERRMLIALYRKELDENKMRRKFLENRINELLTHGFEPNFKLKKVQFDDQHNNNPTQEQ